jgi:hypothetical protein
MGLLLSFPLQLLEHDAEWLEDLFEVTKNLMLLSLVGSE